MSVDGLLVIDKPADWTSHDVVARVRRLAGTRKVGHAGTLDPMATGVLLLGVGKATKLLGHLALTDKSYSATIRLGAGSTTDDAMGELIPGKPADQLVEMAITSEMSRLTGQLDQVPSSVSAIKIEGRRSYARVRAGETVALASRKVTVSRFELSGLTRGEGWLDLEVMLDVTSGTYVRALARDLGAALGVGGHLTALRRTRVGGFTLDQARTLESCETDLGLISLSDAVAACFHRRAISEGEARDLSFGRPLEMSGVSGIVGVFSPDGSCVALVEDRGELAKPVVVFAPA